MTYLLSKYMCVYEYIFPVLWRSRADLSFWWRVSSWTHTDFSILCINQPVENSSRYYSWPHSCHYMSRGVCWCTVYVYTQLHVYVCIHSCLHVWARLSKWNAMNKLCSQVFISVIPSTNPESDVSDGQIWTNCLVRNW